MRKCVEFFVNRMDRREGGAMFISTEDFFNKINTMAPLTDEDFQTLVLRMRGGDEAARDALVRGFLPFVASFIRRAPRRIKTLHTVYACIACVEECVACADGARDKRAFAAELGRRLRQCVIRCLISEEGR